jgi:hypothetical protein
MRCENGIKIRIASHYYRNFFIRIFALFRIAFASHYHPWNGILRDPTYFFYTGTSNNYKLIQLSRKKLFSLFIWFFDFLLWFWLVLGFRSFLFSKPDFKESLQLISCPVSSTSDARRNKHKKVRQYGIWTLTISPNAVDLPIGRVEVFRPRRPHDNVLQVTPGEVVVGLERQGADASSQGCRSRRPRVRLRAPVMQVRRHDLFKNAYNVSQLLTSYSTTQ